jgi:hypothetical protein
MSGRSTKPSGAIVLLMLTAIQSACTTTQVDDRPVSDLSNVDLYQRLCSSCHGVDARGSGPVAPLITIGVPDLTLLAHRSGGEFPAEDVRRVIDGRKDRPAHGPRDMPVWGWQLYDGSSRNDSIERARVDTLVDRLVDYLRSVQQP